MAIETTNADPRVVRDFDPELLWAQYGKKITTAAVVIIAVGLVLYVWQRNAAQQAEAAAARLAAARDIPALEQIVQDYPRQEVAAQALLRLGDALYQQGKYAEAGQKYRQFIEQYPTHSFVASAFIGEAYVREAEGNYQAALDQFQRVLGSRPQSYVTLPATMGVARCLEALGRKQEARQKYEELMALAQGTRLQMEAYVRWMALGRELPPAQPLMSLPTSTEPPAVE
jgi:tetratricopeptide (TPR) repeat protein